MTHPDLQIQQLIDMTEFRKAGRMVYQNFSRDFCPHLVGLTRDNKVVVHAFQYGGFSSKGVVTPTTGAGWRFFYVDEIQGSVETGSDEWYPLDLAKGDKDYVPPKFIVSVWAIGP